MKNNWPTKKLGEILNYEQPSKYIVSSKNYSDDYKTPVLTAGKTFILGKTNEKDNIFPKDKLPVIIFDDFTTATQFVDFQFKVKSSAMKILHAKKDQADIKYLFYLMQTLKMNHATHKRFWISEYSKIEIPLPPLPEQKKIVAKLEKLLEKLKEAKRLRTEAQEAAKNILPTELHKIFGERKNQEKIRNLASLINGRGFKTTEWVSDTKNALPIIRIQNLNNGAKEFNYYVGGYDEKILINPGDLLFSWSGSRGTSFGPNIWSGKRGLLNQHIFKVLYDKSKIDKVYFYFAMKHLVDEVENNLHGGVGLVHITKVKFENLLINVPSLAEQKKIVAHLDSLLEKIKKLQEYQKSTASDLITLEQSILHKSMS